MTLFFLILLGVSVGIFFYQRSRKSKKPILKPSLPVMIPPEPEKPAPAPVSEPAQPAPVQSQPVVVPPPITPPPVPWPQSANPIAQRMAEIAEELKEPELPEPKKEPLLPAAEPPSTPPPNLPVS